MRIRREDLAHARNESSLGRNGAQASVASFAWNDSDRSIDMVDRTNYSLCPFGTYEPFSL